jgi:conjugal transfer mating pair stabilization protein TraN
MTQMVLWFLMVALYSFPVQLLAGDGTCSNKVRMCIEGPETRMISGWPVTRSCWKYESKYDCISQNYVDECGPLVDQGCAQIGSVCVDNVDGNPSKCSLYEQTYQCKVADGVSKNITDCGAQTYCVDGTCFDAGYTPDGDFAMAMTGMEVLRQAGNYLDPNTLTLFNGKASDCRIKLGIFNCCKNNTQGSDQTNGDMMTSMGASLVKSFGTESVKYLGSTAVYDSLFQSDAPNFLVNGLESLLGGSGSSSAFSPSLSYFGLTVGYGAPAAGTTVLVGESGTFFIAFDPVSFAIAIVIYVIVELMSCEQDEQVLAMKRGQNLCAHVGTYCSTKVLGACAVSKQSYCCYNSRIARLIATAGHAQLGKSWGDPKTPDCGGLTAAELQMIDFSLIDFSEVVADVKANVKHPDQAIGRATTQINSYYAIP